MSNLNKTFKVSKSHISDKIGRVSRSKLTMLNVGKLQLAHCIDTHDLYVIAGKVGVMIAEARSLESIQRLIETEKITELFVKAYLEEYITKRDKDGARCMLLQEVYDFYYRKDTTKDK